MSTLHSKSVIARTAFPLLQPRETFFLIFPFHVRCSNEECTGLYDFFLFLSFTFYFYFTLVRTYTLLSTHTAHAVNDLAVHQLLLWLRIARTTRRCLSHGQYSFFPSYYISIREETTIQKHTKKKETESGAPLALNAIECSLSLCHVDRFKWLSDKSSRRLVQMYLWRRTRRRKEKRRKKIRTI